MKKRQGWLFFIIFLLTLSIYLLINYPLKFGLDFQGGSSLTLQLVKEEGNVTRDELEAVQFVLDKRVNNLGVSESNLQTLGRDQLILELPGVNVKKTKEAERILGKTALLEFRRQKVGTNSELKKLQLQRASINNLIYQFNSNRDEKSEFIALNNNLINIQNELNFSPESEVLYQKLIETKKYINNQIAKLFMKTDLTGKDLIDAGRRQEQTNNNWEVTLKFNDEGAKKFALITKSIAGTDQFLSIILDGESISEASVPSQFAVNGIDGGLATISGSFNAQEARDLEVQLKGGSLPLPIKIIERNNISPLLGKKNIIESLYAAISGLLFVGIFMIFNYRILGLVSVLSLILYGFFNLAFYSLIPVTLTLPGISGLILSIGMAVDANILIFERIREELKNGNTLIRSIDSGFQRANSSIIDGHITTFISCFVLFLLGTNFVKGFAVTLGLGVGISLFTSLNCSKTILRFFTTYQSLRQKNLYLPGRNISN
mgnify:CR=1 FL=1